MKRTDIKLGYSCNNNCRFCIIGDRRNQIKDKSTALIKNELLHFKKTGTEKVLLTGGEPTIRKDILGIISYAKKLNFKKIHIESNGRMFSYAKFLDRIIHAGATDFSISLHADTPELYSYLTNTQSPSFEQATDGIKNICLRKKNLCVNTTIMKHNYQKLRNILNLISKIGVKSINFPFVNPYGLAWDNHREIVPKLSDVEPFLQGAIDFAQKNKIHVTTEMIPFCFLKKNVSVAAEYHPRNIQIAAPDYFDPDFIKNQNKGRVKGNQCSLCEYSQICSGVMAGYARIFGTSELKPFYDESRVYEYLKRNLPSIFSQEVNLKKLAHHHNLVFEAQLKDKSDFIIKFYKDFNPSSIKKLKFFMDFFNNKNNILFPNTKIIQDSAICYSLSKKIDGKLLSDIWPSLNESEKKDFTQKMARVLGEMHSIKTNVPKDILNKESEIINFQAYLGNKLKSSLEKINENRALPENITSKILNYANLCKSFIPEQVHLSITHNEYRPEHILVRDGKIVSVIDLETMDFGFKELDINQAELYLEPKFRKIFIEEYKKHGALRDDYQNVRKLYFLIKLLDHFAINKNPDKKFNLSDLIKKIIESDEEIIFN